MWEKLKSTRVWLAIAAAVVVVLQAVGIKVDAPVVNEVISAVCAVLVILGFMNFDSDTEETLSELGFDDLIDELKGDSDSADEVETAVDSTRIDEEGEETITKE